MTEVMNARPSLAFWATNAEIAKEFEKDGGKRCLAIISALAIDPPRVPAHQGMNLLAPALFEVLPPTSGTRPQDGADRD